MHTSSKTIDNLIKSEPAGLAVSIYIPTHPASSGPNLTADQIRFKNAIKQVRQSANYSEEELGRSMRQLENLHDDIEFWSHQDAGLAILLNRDTIEYINLPFEVTEAAYVTDHPVFSPLLVMREVDANFYVSDVNVSSPRLLHSAYGRLEEVNKENMPASLDEEVGKGEYKKEFQHSPTGTSLYHAHTEADTVNDEVRRYLKLLAEAIDTYLNGTNTPLLLAGAANRTSALRKELRHGHIIEESYSGSVEHLNATELYEACEPIAQRYFAEQRDAAVNQLKDAPPELVAVGKEEIIAITKHERGGRIERLYLPIFRLTNDTVRAGDNRSLIIELPEDIETIEEAVTSVVRQGGRIIPVEIGAYDFLDTAKALCRY